MNSLRAAPSPRQRWPQSHSCSGLLLRAGLPTQLLDGVVNVGGARLWQVGVLLERGLELLDGTRRRALLFVEAGQVEAGQHRLADLVSPQQVLLGGGQITGHH